MRLHNLIGWPIKWALARAGYGVFSSAEYNIFPRAEYDFLVSRYGPDFLVSRYGHDVFVDIQRLSQAWRYSIDIFFDVGANDGETIHSARERFGNCRIIAFEPHPNTF